MSNLIKIISLEYSGSTILDLLLSNTLDNAVSLGEVERTIEPHASSPADFNCSCGRTDCIYWSQHAARSYSQFIESLTNTMQDKYVIDSSKTISSLEKLKNNSYTLIFLYKNSIQWSASCISRLNRREVRIFSSRQPLKMLIPFFRIEIMRRFLLPIPFEWFFRNLRLLLYIRNLLPDDNKNILCIDLESIMKDCSGMSVSTMNSHIIRGNKIMKQDLQIIRQSSPAFTSLLDCILSLFIANSGIRKLNSYDELVRAIQC